MIARLLRRLLRCEECDGHTARCDERGTDAGSRLQCERYAPPPQRYGGSGQGFGHAVASAVCGCTSALVGVKRHPLHADDAYCISLAAAASAVVECTMATPCTPPPKDGKPRYIMCVPPLLPGWCMCRTSQPLSVDTERGRRATTSGRRLDTRPPRRLRRGSRRR